MLSNDATKEANKVKSEEDVSNTNDDQTKKNGNQSRFYVKKNESNESNCPVKLVKQSGKLYPRNCEDCRKYLRNNNDFRKHIEGCMIAKYCK